MMITSAFGFMRGEKEGMVIGFFCGLLQDVFFGELLGFHALIFLYFGYLNGKFSGIFYPEDIKLPIALITVSDLTYGMSYYILLFLLRGRFEFTYYFSRIIFPEVVYTILVTMLFYPLILKINQKLESREQRRAKKFV
jgi:rod shape-determining protein MreD